MTEPAALIQRYKTWSERMVALFRDLLPDPDYEYLFDPYWVSAYPYRVDLREKETQTVTVTVRNFRKTRQTHEVILKTPPGIQADPSTVKGIVEAQGRSSFEVKLTVKDRSQIGRGVQMTPLDIRLDGQHHGQLFDFILLAKDDE